MSGSPVYIDGRLVGAVSYALGSFPKEPIAGITPIAEMVDAVESAAARARPGDLALDLAGRRPTGLRGARRAWRAARRAARPHPSPTLRVDRAGVAGRPRPVAAADRRGHGAERLRSVGRPRLCARRSSPPARRSNRRAGASRSTAPNGRCVPAIAVGMSLMRGDLEMGATGTVTHVDGNRVYAFGHPFLNLGPTTFADDAGARLHRAAEPRLLDEDRDAGSGDRHDDAGSRDRRSAARSAPRRASST